MEYITLSNGVRMPMLGCGVFQIDPGQTEQCVLDAIAAGCRSIDTAQGYYNEEGVGAAVAKCGIPREEFFLTTKIWISNAGYLGAVDKVTPKRLKYGIIRTERGRGYAVKISHGNDRGSGAGESFPAEIGSGTGLILCT